MPSATQLVWEDAGRPVSTRSKLYETRQRCAVCGYTCDRMVRAKDALPSASFTGYDALQYPSSDAVCEACAWAMEGKPPDTLRMWSVVYQEDACAVTMEGSLNHGPHTYLFNKADPSPAIRILTEPSKGAWVCSLADSGKIHVLPYAKVNHGAGPWVVRFEREDVVCGSLIFKKILTSVQGLLDAGFSKRDILTREPAPGRLAKIGIWMWKQYIAELGGGRDAAVIRLAVFLARKEKADNGKTER